MASDSGHDVPSDDDLRALRSCMRDVELALREKGMRQAFHGVGLDSDLLPEAVICFINGGRKFKLAICFDTYVPSLEETEPTYG